MLYNGELLFVFNKVPIDIRILENELRKNRILRVGKSLRLRKFSNLLIFNKQESKMAHVIRFR